MTLDKITSALATGGQHLGDVVYWTLAEARIDRSTLENIWNAAQLSPAMLPEPPTAEKLSRPPCGRPKASHVLQFAPVASNRIPAGQPGRMPISAGLDPDLLRPYGSRGSLQP